MALTDSKVLKIYLNNLRSGIQNTEVLNELSGNLLEIVKKFEKKSPESCKNEDLKALGEIIVRNVIIEETLKLDDIENLKSVIYHEDFLTSPMLIYLLGQYLGEGEIGGRTLGLINYVKDRKKKEQLIEFFIYRYFDYNYEEFEYLLTLLCYDKKLSKLIKSFYKVFKKQMPLDDDLKNSFKDFISFYGDVNPSEKMALFSLIKDNSYKISNIELIKLYFLSERLSVDNPKLFDLILKKINKDTKKVVNAKNLNFDGMPPYSWIKLSYFLKNIGIKLKLEKQFISENLEIESFNADSYLLIASLSNENDYSDVLTFISTHDLFDFNDGELLSLSKEHVDFLNLNFKN